MKLTELKEYRYELMLLAGAILVISISLKTGFASEFMHAVEHLKVDFGPELLTHIYIFGIILIIYSAFRLLQKLLQEQSS